MNIKIFLFRFVFVATGITLVDAFLVLLYAILVYWMYELIELKERLEEKMQYTWKDVLNIKTITLVVKAIRSSERIFRWLDVWYFFKKLDDFDYFNDEIENK